MPQSAAADRWLSTAPGPAARTAASQLPYRVSRRCPTAYTPRWTTWRCPRRRSRVMVCRPTPSANNWRRAATPCWRLARAAIATVGASDRDSTAIRGSTPVASSMCPGAPGTDARPPSLRRACGVHGECHIPSASCSPARSSPSPRSSSPPSPRPAGRHARRPDRRARVRRDDRLQPVRCRVEPVLPHRPPRRRRGARAPAGRSERADVRRRHRPGLERQPRADLPALLAAAGRAHGLRPLRLLAVERDGRAARSATPTTPTTTTRTRRSGAGGSRGRATMARAASRTRSCTRRR